MLRRQFRLQHAADFRDLRRDGHTYRHPMLILIAAARNRPVSRFGFSASRRYGNAVARNRARRLLRESIRLHLSSIHTGWDCLFIVRRPLANASFQEVEAVVVGLLERAGLLDVAKRDTAQ
jgi:ribonuclease P protein component